MPVEKPCFQGFSNGAKRARTADLLGAIQALSQLSYSPEGPCSVARSARIYLILTARTRLHRLELRHL